MSKITPKNLSYDTSLPPFLQRLKGEFAGPSDGRHERAIARPKRTRDADADAEDEPAYVDEETNHTLSKEEYTALVGADKNIEKENSVDGSAREEEAGKEYKEGKDEANSRVMEKERIAGIGVAKRRKIGKVIGEAGEENGEIGKKDVRSETKPKAGSVKKAEAPRSKKKDKMVKLSFNDDEEG